MSLIFVRLTNVVATNHAIDRLKERKIDAEKAYLKVNFVRKRSLKDVVRRWKNKHGPSKAVPSYLLPTIDYEGEYYSDKEPDGFVRYRLIVGDDRPKRKKKLITAYRIDQFTATATNKTVCEVDDEGFRIVSRRRPRRSSGGC